MGLFLNRFFKLLLVFIILASVGCSARVPKEVVELSYSMGKDLQAIHLSYRELIHKHFDGLRAQTVSFLDDRWVPQYLEDFIQSGELVESAQAINPKQVLEDVQIWAEVAIEEIEDKKTELLDPISKDEEALLKLVDEAFANLTRANATITAHLNSIRHLKEVQQEILSAFRLTDLRDKIDRQLIAASENVQKNIDKLIKVEVGINKVEKKKEELKKKLGGENKNE